MTRKEELVRVHKLWADSYIQKHGRFSERKTKLAHELEGDSSVPEKFDWRDHREINPSGDQLQTGLCYLFASLYSFSDRFAIAQKAKYIKMSIVQAAAALKIGNFNPDPMNNGSPPQFTQMVKKYYTVAYNANNKNTALDLFCSTVPFPARNCECQSGCDDDEWQTVISRSLPTNLDIYENVEHFPNKEKWQVSGPNNNLDLTFPALKKEVYLNGPLPYIYFFNRDFWRNNENGTAWKETGNIYMCTDWENGDNPFGYTASGRGDEGGGHCISIIGFGTDRVAIKYRGRKYQNVVVNYAICRNSWGEDSDKSYFKAAWEGNLNLGGENVLIMNDVWRGTSPIKISPIKIDPIRPQTFTCDRTNFNCKPDEAGSFTDYSICEKSCVPGPNPEKEADSGKSSNFKVISLVIFVIIAMVVAVILAYIIYKRQRV